MADIVYILTSLFSTFAGAVSGMGGGVIMKPVFDMLGSYSAFEISVLTSCTMLAMSMISVCTGVKKFINEKESTGIILFIIPGSLAGGYIGNALFNLILDKADDLTVKIIQNALLFILVISVIFYMNGSKKSLNIKYAAAGLPVGAALGIVSAFLGIGGGPVNVAVLTAVFGFGMQTSVLCSLTSVFVSQATKVAAIAFQSGTASFEIKILPFVIIAGILGALGGRTVSKKTSEKSISLLFTVIQIIVLVMCCINIARSLMQ